MGTATTRWVAEEPDTCSSTDTSQRPSAVVLPSACRTSGPPVSVSRTGTPVAPAESDPPDAPAEEVGLFEDYPEASFDAVMDVNVKGTLLCCQVIGGAMAREGRGSIINICSIIGSGANELNVIAYSAAKGAVRNLTQQLGCEWADRGVRVNAISPGFVVTEMIRPALEAGGVAAYISSRTPMRRLCDISELQGPLLFLASEASSYITGLDLLVDGGTNAGNGYYQIEPGHHFSSQMLAPAVGQHYPGLQPLPAELEVWKMGIPGIHFEMPDAPA